MKAAEIIVACKIIISMVCTARPKESILDGTIQSSSSPPRNKICTGTLYTPKRRSANAKLMIGYKHFLRSFLFVAKRTIVSKFAATIKTASNTKALHHAIPAALEGSSSVDEKDLLLKPSATDMFSIFPFESKRQKFSPLLSATRTCDNTKCKMNCVVIKTVIRTEELLHDRESSLHCEFLKSCIINSFSTANHSSTRFLMSWRHGQEF